MNNYGLGKPRGPYGTNEGDIWSGEDSPVGQMLMERNGLLLIHEVIDGEDSIYNVDPNNPDPDMQDLIKRARAGTAKWLAAQAAQN